MTKEEIDDLLEDTQDTIFDDFWILSILILSLFNNDKKADNVINIYINGDKVGE